MKNVKEAKYRQKMNLLSKKENNKLTFCNEVNSLEFVELIGDMDLSYSVNYIKRDLYLKKYGQKLFNGIKQKKIKKSIIKINFNYKKAYISENAIKNKLKLFLRKFLNFSIEININLLKFDNYSNCFDCYSDNMDNKEIEVLSQDEIDKMLTAINVDDEKK